MTFRASEGAALILRPPLTFALLLALPAAAATYNDPVYRPQNVRITGGTISGVTISGITLTPADSLFTLLDDADPTKKLQFELSGITTGATRTLIVPNASGTLLYSGGPLGTPSSGVLASATGLPISSGVSGLGTGVATALAIAVGSAGGPVTNGGALGTPSSGVATNLTGTATALNIGGNAATATALAANPTDCSANQYATAIAASGNLTCSQPAASNLSNGTTGTGSIVLATSPVLTLTLATGLPISTGVSGLGTGIATALAANTGSAGAPVLFNGALGTPSSGTLTTATGLPIATGVSGLASGAATFLAAPSSANLAALVTDEVGTGNIALATQNSWTPTDVSGAGLSFSGAAGYYYRIGDLISISGALVFPATASGAAVQIGSLPCTAKNVTANRGGSVTYTDLAATITARTLEGTTTMFLYDTAGANKTNAQMSGKEINVSATYVCA